MHELFNGLHQNPFFSGGLTLMLLGSAVALLRKVPGQIWNFVKRRVLISVEIPDRDPAFRWVQNWLAEQRYARRSRGLSLTTIWVNPEPTAPSADDWWEEDGSTPGSKAQFVLSPAPGVHLMTYRGRLLILNRTRRDLQSGGSSAFQETITIHVVGGTRSFIEELLGEAYTASLPKSPGVSVLTSQQHSWQTTSWQPKRPLGSLVLADSILEDLLADLREFYRSGAWYAERGIPYRRGYLLHGPPGTGKTTLVLALAGELKLSVAVLSLSSRLMSDDALRSMIDALPVATLLLIEDVDCVFKDQRKTTNETGVTLSGLLNALDGVSSREGRVLFLTTNHPEKLDPALVRPGRVDRKVELGYATPDQARRLFLWFYRGCGPSLAELSRLADRFAAQIPAGKLCMAAIQEHLLRHRREPEAAAHEVAFEEIAAEVEVPAEQVGADRGAASAHSLAIETAVHAASVPSA
jgi:chaperone BCS1